jgi:hypothetical protein
VRPGEPLRLGLLDPGRFAGWVASVPRDVWVMTPRQLCAYLERVGFATLPPTEPEVFA